MGVNFRFDSFSTILLGLFLLVKLLLGETFLLLVGETLCGGSFALLSVSFPLLILNMGSLQFRKLFHHGSIRVKLVELYLLSEFNIVDVESTELLDILGEEGLHESLLGGKDVCGPLALLILGELWNLLVEIWNSEESTVSDWSCP